MISIHFALPYAIQFCYIFFVMSGHSTLDDMLFINREITTFARKRLTMSKHLNSNEETLVLEVEVIIFSVRCLK